MCCDLPADMLAPPPVAEMLMEYRRLQASGGFDWGGEFEASPGFFFYGRFTDRARLFAELREAGGDWDEALRRCLRDELPRGVIVATPGEGGLALRTGPLPYRIDERPVQVALVVDAPASRVQFVEVEGDEVIVEWEGETRATIAVEQVAHAKLRLRAGVECRWSVIDDRGGGWFPPSRLEKWDFHDRPFFHGDEMVLDVPVVPLTVTAARGLEYAPSTTSVTLEPGEERTIDLRPLQLFDPTATGWFGGDLHVHMNYSGDLVCTPHDAALMQRGEGLHLMNLVAGNLLTARVYDREALEHFAGEDLPWSRKGEVARFGVEYRNDLLGHFHALGLSTPPSRYQSGHERSDHPDDWPPNAVACEELRGLGATVGYTHPVFGDLSDDSPESAFRNPRSVEARELVADAALGLVDSVDLLGPSNTEGSARLYHHLLNCGLRLAATVGTDVFLSYSRSSNFSNPPGWARVYADLRGAPLSVTAFQEAVRRGRTMATNGPWLELSVDGHGPGEVIYATGGQTLHAVARVTGLGAERIELVGPDGALASTDANELRTTLTVGEPMWVAAVARGPSHPAVLSTSAFAHTSPVHVEVGGRRIGRAEDARWCLDWLDRFEDLARNHGRFSQPAQLEELLDVIERARAFYASIA